MNNPNTVKTLSPRTIAQQKYDVARGNLLLMLILTAVNVILLLFDSSTMLLFSATIPYVVVLFGVAMEETTAIVFAVSIAALIIVLYLTTWIFSKKKYGFMVFALIMFLLDTAFMVGIYLWSGDFSGILDVLIHAWVLYYLVIGVINGRKLKTLPPETASEAWPPESEEQFPDNNT